MTLEEQYRQETGHDAKNLRGGYSTGEKFEWLERYTNAYVEWLERKVALAVARFRAVERTLESVRVYGWKCGDTVNYYAEMQAAIAAYDAAVKGEGE